MRIQGRAVVAGIRGAVTATAWASGAKVLMTGVEDTHQWDTLEEIDDPDTGEPIGFVTAKDRHDLVIDFIPAADTAIGNTLANAKKTLPFPSAYAIVTLSSFDLSTFNDTWLYVGGGSQSYTAKGAVKWRLPLRRYTDIDDSAHTALSTVISA